MPSLSPIEIATVAVVALIVFGPHKLPQIARQIGRAMTELRRMASEVKSEFDSGLGDYDDEDGGARPTRARARAGGRASDRGGPAGDGPGGESAPAAPPHRDSTDASPPEGHGSPDAEGRRVDS